MNWLQKNKDFLAGLKPGDRFLVVDLLGDERRPRRMEFVHAVGDTLTALDSARRIRRFSLRFCSCRQYRLAATAGQVRQRRET